MTRTWVRQKLRTTIIVSEYNLEEGLRLGGRQLSTMAESLGEHYIDESTLRINITPLVSEPDIDHPEIIQGIVGINRTFQTRIRMLAYTAPLIDGQKIQIQLDTHTLYFPVMFSDWRE